MNKLNKENAIKLFKKKLKDCVVVIDLEKALPPPYKVLKIIEWKQFLYVIAEHETLERLKIFVFRIAANKENDLRNPIKVVNLSEI